MDDFNIQHRVPQQPPENHLTEQNSSEVHKKCGPKIKEIIHKLTDFISGPETDKIFTARKEKHESSGHKKSYEALKNEYTEYFVAKRLANPYAEVPEFGEWIRNEEKIKHTNVPGAKEEIAQKPVAGHKPGVTPSRPPPLPPNLQRRRGDALHFYNLNSADSPLTPEPFNMEESIARIEENNKPKKDPDNASSSASSIFPTPTEGSSTETQPLLPNKADVPLSEDSSINTQPNPQINIEEKPQINQKLTSAIKESVKNEETYLKQLKEIKKSSETILANINKIKDAVRGDNQKAELETALKAMYEKGGLLDQLIKKSEELISKFEKIQKEHEDPNIVAFEIAKATREILESKNEQNNTGIDVLTKVSISANILAPHTEAQDALKNILTGQNTSNASVSDAKISEIEFMTLFQSFGCNIPFQRTLRYTMPLQGCAKHLTGEVLTEIDSIKTSLDKINLSVKEYEVEKVKSEIEAALKQLTAIKKNERLKLRTEGRNSGLETGDAPILGKRSTQGKAAITYLLDKMRIINDLNNNENSNLIERLKNALKSNTPMKQEIDAAVEESMLSLVGKMQKANQNIDSTIFENQLNMLKHLKEINNGILPPKIKEQLKNIEQTLNQPSNDNQKPSSDTKTTPQDIFIEQIAQLLNE